MNITTRPYLITVRLFIILWIGCCPLQGRAAQILTDKLDLNCSQTESMLLACSYRLLIPVATVGITARSGDQTLEITTSKTYPVADSVTAVLFLVDTSDPGRQGVISKNAGQIAQILAKLGPHHRTGLASFDKELVINVPVGGTSSEIAEAARSLTASGLTTELYRNTIKAIEFIARTNADRKVIYLLSDGQAEDKAYFHEDVVRSALKQGVIINSLGYPRSIALSVALQTLRRLSEETGGVFVETDTRFELPESFMRGPFDNIDTGGQFIIDLNSLTSARTDLPEVDISLETPAGNISASVPVILTAPPVTAILPSTSLQSTVAAIQPLNTQSVLAPVNPENNLLDTLLWYGVPIALGILILLTLFTLLLIYKRQPQVTPAVNTNVRGLNKPLAYLITQDETAKPYPVASATCRIGRSLDNELTINDSSVSRRHAEIRRTVNGQFVLYDRESTNGVFVNNHKINTHKLKEGDIIEIGDVFLRFTKKPGDFQLGNTTAMLRTRAP